MLDSLSVVLRSCVFALIQILITPPFAVIALLTFPLKPITRYRIISIWARLMVLAAKVVCGIHYRVLGAEHAPSQPCVVLSKHQSAWETSANCCGYRFSAGVLQWCPQLPSIAALACAR
jgi:1-acyl-sn-glycerol-3-phosphate acyltransferase